MTPTEKGRKESLGSVDTRYEAHSTYHNIALNLGFLVLPKTGLNLGFLVLPKTALNLGFLVLHNTALNLGFLVLPNTAFKLILNF